MKGRYLGDILDPNFKKTIIEKVSNNVNSYLNHRKPAGSITISDGDGLPLQSRQQVTSEKNIKFCKIRINLFHGLKYALTMSCHSNGTFFCW